MEWPPNACYDCGQVTSGNCGKHGPTIIRTSAPTEPAPTGEMAAPTVEQLTNMILTALSLAGVSYSTEQRKALAGLLSATKALWEAALRERIRVLEEALVAHHPRRDGGLCGICNQPRTPDVDSQIEAAYSQHIDGQINAAYDAYAARAASSALSPALERIAQQVLNALESDATLEQRRNAFDALRDLVFPVRQARAEMPASKGFSSDKSSMCHNCGGSGWVPPPASGTGEEW